MSRRARSLFPFLVLPLAVISLAPGCAARSHGLATGAADSERSIRFEVRGRIDLPEGKTARFEAAGVWSPPESLRLEVRGPIGGVRVLAAVRGETLRVLWPAERRYLESSASRESWERLLGLPLTTAEIASLLLDPAGEAGPGRGVLSRQGWRIERRRGRFSLAPADPEAGPFRRLELSRVKAVPVDPPALSPSLFDVAIPAGWTRVEPSGPDETILLAP